MLHMKVKNQVKIRADWWSKTLAGAVLGLVIAIEVGALVAQGFTNIDRALAPQLGMWAIAWSWCPLFFLAYFIPRGWQALTIYAVTAVLAYSCILWLRG